MIAIVGCLCTGGGGHGTELYRLNELYRQQQYSAIVSEISPKTADLQDVIQLNYLARSYLYTNQVLKAMQIYRRMIEVDNSVSEQVVDRVYQVCMDYCTSDCWSGWDGMLSARQRDDLEAKQRHIVDFVKNHSVIDKKSGRPLARNMGKFEKYLRDNCKTNYKINHDFLESAMTHGYYNLSLVPLHNLKMMLEHDGCTDRTQLLQLYYYLHIFVLARYEQFGKISDYRAYDKSVLHLGDDFYADVGLLAERYALLRRDYAVSEEGVPAARAERLVAAFGRLLHSIEELLGGLLAVDAPVVLGDVLAQAAAAEPGGATLLGLFHQYVRLERDVVLLIGHLRAGAAATVSQLDYLDGALRNMTELVYELNNTYERYRVLDVVPLIDALDGYHDALLRLRLRGAPRAGAAVGCAGEGLLCRLERAEALRAARAETDLRALSRADNERTRLDEHGALRAELEGRKHSYRIRITNDRRHADATPRNAW